MSGTNWRKEDNRLLQYENHPLQSVKKRSCTISDLLQQSVTMALNKISLLNLPSVVYTVYTQRLTHIKCQSEFPTHTHKQKPTLSYSHAPSPFSACESLNLIFFPYWCDFSNCKRNKEVKRYFPQRTNRGRQSERKGGEVGH